MFFTPLLGAMDLGTVPSYQGVREDVLGITMRADSGMDVSGIFENIVVPLIWECEANTPARVHAEK